MIEILLSAVFAAELIAISLVMNHFTKCFSAFSIPGMAFIFLLAVEGIYIPIIFLKNQIYGPLELDEAIKIQLFLTLGLMYLFFALGVVFSSLLLKFKTGEFYDYIKKPILPQKSILLATTVLFFLMMFFIYYFSVEFETIARFKAYFSSFGNSNLIKEMRADFGHHLNNSGIVGYFWSMSLFVFFPLLSLILIALAHTGKNFLIKIFAGIAFLATCFALFSGLHRAPLVQFLAMAAVSLLLFKGKLFYQKKKLLLLLLLAIILGSLMYVFTYGVSLGTGIYYLYNRFTEGSNLAWILHLKYFPETFDFLWGRDIGIVSKIMGWDYISSPQLIAETFGARGANFNALFISGLWVNFGYFGIIIGSFLLGAYLQGIQIWLLRSSRTPARMALFGYLCFNVWYLVNISIFPAIFSFGLVTAPLLVVAGEVIAAFFWQIVFLRTSPFKST